MPITSVQTAAALEVINEILAATATKGKRQLAVMFLELVDRTDWPHYYDVIPEPRCLNNIKSGVEKGRYKDATDIYTDLSLVFWNALFYNELSSQIALDAKTLKTLLETEWQKRSILPHPRTSPPPSSAQKVHKVAEELSVDTTPPPAATLASAPVASPLPAPSAARTTRSTPIPATSTGTNNFTHIKPATMHTRSSRLSPEMEVDIISEDESGNDGVPSVVKRDQESEEIVKQLEKGLPRWPGLGEEGWSDTITQERTPEIVHAIKSYKDVIGNRLAVVLEAVPDDSHIPCLSSAFPLSFRTIESRARSKSYQNSKNFDMEMMRFFEKARRWHKLTSEPYGCVLLLQRLYQSLTSPNPPPGPPYSTTSNFASLIAGPGNIKSVPGGDTKGVAVTTHRILTVDRKFVDQLHYKGLTVTPGDWVHLSNPDDPSRPIVAQIFKCWVSDLPSQQGRPGLTVSWYYRPEQTFHLSNRMFLESEVFKTSLFADHPLEDIIERISCQFSEHHVLGRPRPPYWYPELPLYVCESRYHDRDRIFVKIKNWGLCVPEEVRNAEDSMPIYPFERPVIPHRLPSPFIGRGVKGPGGLMADDRAQHQGNDNQEMAVLNGGNLRSRQNGGDAGTKGYATSQAASDRSVVITAGAQALGTPTERLPAETAKHFDRDPETNEVLWFPAPPVDVARPSKPKYSLEYLHFIATKRKRDIADPDADAMVLDNSDSLKRGRLNLEIPPTVTETLKSVLRETNA